MIKTLAFRPGCIPHIKLLALRIPHSLWIPHEARRDLRWSVNRFFATRVQNIVPRLRRSIPRLIRNPGLTAGAIHCRAFGAMAWRCSARPEGPSGNRPGRQAGIRIAENRAPKARHSTWLKPVPTVFPALQINYSMTVRQVFWLSAVNYLTEFRLAGGSAEAVRSGNVSHKLHMNNNLWI